MFIPQLTIPATQAVPDPRLLIKPTELEAWIGSLPLADARGSMQRVHEAIALLNRHAVPVPARFVLLERYRLLYLLFLDFARGPRGATLAPGADGTGKAGPFTLLTTEMAYGYKVIVKEILARDRRIDKDRLGLPAAHRAMRFLSYQIIHAFQHYGAMPIHAWRELCQLYLCSEDCGVHDGSVAEQRDQQKLTSSPGTLFKQTAMTILADPYRLPAGEVWRAYDLLHEMSRQVQIMPLIEGTDGDVGMFAVNLHAADRPKPLRELPSERLENWRLLDATGLLDRLDQLLAELDDTTVDLPLPQGFVTARDARATIQRWLDHWRQSSARGQARTHVSRRADAACGIYAAHFFLGGVADAPASQIEESSEDSIEIAQPGMRDTQIQRSKHALLPCQLVNESAGGVALSCARATPRDALHIGQIVALQRDQSDWRVGVVRWLGQDPVENALRVGIQFVNGSVRAANVLMDGGAPNDRSPALQFEMRDDPQFPHQLVTVRGFFQPHREFRLQAGPGRQSTARAVRILESTRYFERFAISN